MGMQRPTGKLGRCHRCGGMALCRDDIGRSCHAHCYEKHYDAIHEEIDSLRRKGYEVSLKPETCRTCLKPVLHTNVAGDEILLDLESPTVVAEVRLIVAGRRTFALHTMETPSPSGTYTCTWVMPRRAADVKPGDSTKVLVEHEHPIIKYTDIKQTEAESVREQTRRQVADAFQVPPRLVGVDAEPGNRTVLAVLQDAGKPLAAWEVAQHSQGSVNEVLKQLEALRDAGHVARLSPSGTGDPVRWVAQHDGTADALGTEALGSQGAQNGR